MSAVLLATTSYAHAAGPPEMPVARIAGVMHSALIKKLDVSADGTVALTASDDKTAKVWDLRNPNDANRPRLQRTLRVPIGEGYEGQLYTGALSPNGQLAALGGYTAIEWDGAASIYFMNTATGRMQGRLYGLPGGGPATIENLKFSRDGLLLAACFWREADSRFILQIYDLRKVAQGPAAARLAHDDSIKGRILGIDFARNGDLTVASMDGVVHQYRASERYANAHRVTLGAALEPMHVRYSPDDHHVAIGLNQATRIAVLDAQTLRTERFLDLPRTARQAGLHAVEWSGNGAYLFAAGEPAGTETSTLYRWSFNSPQSLTDKSWQVSERRVTDLFRVGPDSILLSSADPSISLFTIDGATRWTVRSSAPYVRHDPVLFRASPDGLDVQFSVTANGARLVRFSTSKLDERALIRLAGSAPDMAPPKREAQGLRVEITNRNRSVLLNGKPFPLGDKEEAYSYALSEDANTAYVGTLWAIRAIRRAGTQLWQHPVSSPVYQLTSANQGRYIIAALGDGTIRWLRSSDGAEIAALYVSPAATAADADEWILWSPDGRYAASPHGDELIGWHVNRDANSAPRFYRAVQFERVLYDPASVQRAFATNATPSAVAFAARPESLREILDMAPPDIWIATAAASTAQSATARLEISAEADRADMLSLTAYVNDLPVIPHAARTITDAERKTFKRRIEVPLTAAGNEIRIEISNGRAIGLAETWLPGMAREREKRGTLYVMAVGVSWYDEKSLPNLAFAAKDAVDFAREFGRDAAPLYDRVVTRLLADTESFGGEQGSIPLPTAADIRNTLPFLADAGPRDTVVLFLAAHGINSKSGDYYFVPQDATAADVNRLLESNATEAPSLVSWDAFFKALSDAAGQRLLVVDTCHSADIRGVAQTFVLAKRSAASRFALLAASKGSELSRELDDEEQGAFTYALLSALRTPSAAGSDGVLSLQEAYDHVLPKVQEKVPAARGPQTPQLIAPRSLADMMLRGPFAALKTSTTAGREHVR